MEFDYGEMSRVNGLVYFILGVKRPLEKLIKTLRIQFRNPAGGQWFSNDRTFCR